MPVYLLLANAYLARLLLGMIFNEPAYISSYVQSLSITFTYIIHESKILILYTYIL
jgi:hypothetical protein